MKNAAVWLPGKTITKISYLRPFGRGTAGERLSWGLEVEFCNAAGSSTSC